jgi:hypothetical protein
LITISIGCDNPKINTIKASHIYRYRKFGREYSFMTPAKKYAIITLVVLLVAALIVFIVLSQTNTMDKKEDDPYALITADELRYGSWNKTTFPEDEPPENYGSDTLMIVGLFIRSNDTVKRDLIRSVLFKHPVFEGDNPKAVIRFIIGHPKDGDTKAIRKEMKEKQDMILFPFTDTYDNLSIKTTLFFRYYSSHHKKYSFITKLDDDTYFNFEYIIDYIENHVQKAASKYWYIGSMCYGAVPTTDPNNKYYTPEEQYSEDTFPTYALGHAYILSKELARQISISEFRILRLEDTEIGCRVAKYKEVSSHYVQYVDITEIVGSDGTPIFWGQIDSAEEWKAAYSHDISF